MTSILSAHEVVAAAVETLRGVAVDGIVTLSQIQSASLEVAEDLAPVLIDDFSSVKGLRVLVPILQAMPETIVPVSEELGKWKFVELL